MIPLFSLGGLSVTPYALCIALAAAVSITLSILALKRHGLSMPRALDFMLLALPLAFLGARLFYFLAKIGMLLAEFGWGFFFDFARGGYALWGAVGGVALACLIVGKTTHKRFSFFSDAIAPYAALMIALARFAEYFSGEGIGPWIEDEALRFFPLGVMDVYEEWYFAVFLLEGVIALIISFLVAKTDYSKSGKRTLVFLILYSASQTLCESMRQDAYLRFGFVRVSQLVAVIVLSLILIITLVKDRDRLSIKRRATTFAVFLICVGICIALEFAKDKSAALPDTLIYLIMAVSCTGLGTSTWSAVCKIYNN